MYLAVRLQMHPQHNVSLYKCMCGSICTPSVLVSPHMRLIFYGKKHRFDLARSFEQSRKVLTNHSGSTYFHCVLEPTLPNAFYWHRTKGIAQTDIIKRKISAQFPIILQLVF